jgi:hypothetical protein
VFKRFPAEPIAPSASSEEASAIMAALERFDRDTTIRPAEVEGPADGWTRAAILEGLRQPEEASWLAGSPDPWINT